MAEKGHDCKHSPFFLPLHSSFFFLQNYTRRFFRQNDTRRFFNAIITRDVFSAENYTRRFFRRKLHATFFQCDNLIHAAFFKCNINCTRRVFFNLRSKLRVSMKMGAIIRLVCFIKTKYLVNTTQKYITFQSINMNIYIHLNLNVFSRGK